jgi:4'-phosphopantetheinyl transferase
MSVRDTARPSGPASATGGWPAGPQAPRLAPGGAHVWRADLRAVAEDLLGALSADERDRAAAMSGAGARGLWSRSRGVLRALLARYLRCGAADVALAVGELGKPELLSVPAGVAPLHFNLSHSQGSALYAFSADGPVGVDVQAVRPDGARAPVDHVALARRAFGEREAQRLGLVEPARREWEFLRAWTRYEAQVKQLGLGIGGARVADAPPWAGELDVGQNAAAALSLNSPASDLRLWAWA